MSFRAYVWLMTFATVVAWLTWGFVIWRVDPEESGLAGLALFYVTLFAAMVGTLAVTGVIYRVGYRGRRHVVSREVKIAFRHAFLLSLVGVVTLSLSATNLLRWWAILILFVTVGLVEYFFLLIQDSQRH